MSDEAAVAEHGSIRKAAKALGIDESTLRRRLNRARSDSRDSGAVPADIDQTTVEVDEDSGEVVITAPAVKLGAVEDLIRENGLEPDDWVIVSVTLNRWNGLGKAVDGQNPLHTLRQVKVTLRRAPHLIFPVPAVHVPRVARVKPGRKDRNTPLLIVVEGDHQVPYHDPDLHKASLAFLQDVRPDGHVFLGDTGDYPTISKHADHPAAMEPVNDVNQGVYELLRDKREAAPQAWARKLKGNHDWRVESELLLRAERMYDIRPAQTGPEPELPALSLRRLVHLDALEIELVEDPRGWQHAEIELVPGIAGLVVRHGWLTGANTAARSLDKRGRSLLVGHTHGREHVFQWDPSAEVERQAAVVGTMSLVRNQRFPHYAACDGWLQGFASVAIWPDGAFQIDHARWHEGALYWRDQRFRAKRHLAVAA